MAIYWYANAILWGDAGGGSKAIAFHLDCCCGGSVLECCDGSAPARVYVYISQPAAIIQWVTLTLLSSGTPPGANYLCPLIYEGSGIGFDGITFGVRVGIWCPTPGGLGCNASRSLHVTFYGLNYSPADRTLSGTPPIDCTAINESWAWIAEIPDLGHGALSFLVQI